MSPSSQCWSCECRLDVNRPAHDTGCPGDSRNYERCEDCHNMFRKTELVNDICENCRPAEVA